MWHELLLVAVAASMSASAATAAPTFLALGDSYTIGEGVAAESCWPRQLADRLRREGVALADPQIIATTGWTTDELAAAMDASTFAAPYDLVTLSIGVNNQYRGRDGENYRQEFVALLTRAIELAGGHAQRVVVVSIPDWGVTAFGRGSGRDTATIARELDRYNAINREESARHHVAWIDVTPASRTAADQRDQLAADGLHPSAAQYTQWAKAILPAARAALSSR